MYSIRELLTDWGQVASHAYSGLTLEDVERLKDRLGDLGHYRGKVRDVVTTTECVYMIHSDSLSAFDRYIGAVPLKGVMLSELSASMFLGFALIVFTSVPVTSCAAVMLSRFLDYMWMGLAIV